MAQLMHFLFSYLLCCCGRSSKTLHNYYAWLYYELLKPDVLVVFWCRIDHWDMEKERLVLLTTKSILIVQYDFIRLVVSDFRRILFHNINHIQIGDLVYPATSLMPSVHCFFYCCIESFKVPWNNNCDCLVLRDIGVTWPLPLWCSIMHFCLSVSQSTVGL